MRIVTFPPQCATSCQPPGMSTDEALGEIRDHLGLFALLTPEQVVDAVKFAMSRWRPTANSR